jgi:hypothetical protein
VRRTAACYTKTADYIRCVVVILCIIADIATCSAAKRLVRHSSSIVAEAVAVLILSCHCDMKYILARCNFSEQCLLLAKGCGTMYQVSFHIYYYVVLCVCIELHMLLLCCLQNAANMHEAFCKCMLPLTDNAAQRNSVYK